MADNFRLVPYATLDRVVQPPLNPNHFANCFSDLGFDRNEPGLPEWLALGDIFHNVAKEANLAEYWDEVLLKDVPPKFKPLAAGLLIKCFDSLELPEGTTLPRSLYDVARPLFLTDWEFWSQRLSVPLSLSTDFPRAIKGETAGDWPKQRI